MKVKDKIMLVNDIPNKAEIPILNHRDDGEISSIKRQGDTCKVFSFKTLYELQHQYGFKDCEVAIAEDFFWTAMPFMLDGELNLDEDWNILGSCVVASVWGTPCIIVDDKAYACYEVLPRDEFPGVYLNEWDPEFLRAECDKVVDFYIKKIIEAIIEHGDMK